MLHFEPRLYQVWLNRVGDSLRQWVNEWRYLLSTQVRGLSRVWSHHPAVSNPMRWHWMSGTRLPYYMILSIWYRQILVFLEIQFHPHSLFQCQKWYRVHRNICISSKPFSMKGSPWKINFCFIPITATTDNNVPNTFSIMSSAAIM